MPLTDEQKELLNSDEVQKKIQESIEASAKKLQEQHAEELAAIKAKLEAKQGNSNEDAELKELLGSKNNEIEELNFKIKKMQLQGFLSAEINSHLGDGVGSIKNDLSDIVLSMAEQAFKEHAGSFVPFSDNKPRVGANGYMTPSEWIKDLQKIKPSLFVQPSGTGSKPNKNGDGTSKQMTRAEFSKLSPAERMAVAKEYKITQE